MKRFFALAVLLSFLGSCTGESEKQPEGTTGGLQRLMKYYPLDSLSASGDTLYHTLPDVKLVAQDGKDFQTGSLNGKIVVADFFFASCAGTCPRMTSQLTRVQAAFPGNPDLKIASYTVDPARDSAQSLAGYAQRFKADTAQWKFLTGPKKTLYDLARYGYFLPVEPGNGDSEDFIHSDQLILLDREARIRGYYIGTDSAAVDSMIVDIRTLLNEK